MLEELADSAAAESDGLSNSFLKQVERRKSLHFNIKESAHSALRIACFKNSITMQDFFNEISQLVEADSPLLMTIMKDVSDKKRNNQIEKLSKTDEESLYTIIEREMSEKES
jgi:GTPase involved in cell partitioning and DNA repair